ncbi:trehalose-phosphatase-domain-containing protein [Cladochytrium replicatum]|nr:trehalose-phosphatase-domain-containing protein [Cladochytrium replicatum]
MLLKKIASKPDVYIYIISGRSRIHLDNWFAQTGVGLSAEHGCFYRHPSSLGEDFGGVDVAGFSTDNEGAMTNRRKNNGWYPLVDQVDSSWRETIRPLFMHYTERTPGSFIEEKEINLTWHYRNADPEFGSWQAAELQVNLEKILTHMAVSIILGNRTLELRPSTVDKASAARAILKDHDIPPTNAQAHLASKPRLSDPETKLSPETILHSLVSEDGALLGSECDFLLCIGDGKTDEVVFSTLHETFGVTAVANAGVAPADTKNGSKPTTSPAVGLNLAMFRNAGIPFYTVTVGKKQTEALYYVDGVKDVESLLQAIGEDA